MTKPSLSGETGTTEEGPLPADDPSLLTLGLDELVERWATAARRAPTTAEQMTGADRRAQGFGVPGIRLMEHAGTAVAAVIRAVLAEHGRLRLGPVLVLAGPGNNGGDGFVAARRLSRAGIASVVVLVSSEAHPRGDDAGRNWDRLAPEERVTRLHAQGPRDLDVLTVGIERAGAVVDALLGTGVRGVLREPIRSAVELVREARSKGVPVVAIDTPTAIDLTSGEPSDPVVRADVTVTFHRPKVGLLSRRGAALAGRVVVAPIGIPLEADRG